ncbi:MAG: hypothetical protein ACK4RZ_11245 [Paracoccaceae bacterium]
MDNILALAAFALLLAFLAILLWHVPRLDLIVVVTFTVALAGWDLFQSIKGNRG